jgi:HSP20 family molecular chaperone IbpA
MTSVVRQRQILPELFDWAEFLPALFAARGLGNSHMIRIEDDLTEDGYTVRAELPGIDPDKDVRIIVDDDTLLIEAERTERKTEGARSEFRYGSFRRRMSLPAGAKTDDVKAVYADGILTVSIGIGRPMATTRQIEVQRA